MSKRGKRFPKVLRNKWLAIFSLFMLFFLYEWLDLWASPILTAWLIVVYFVGSFVLEAVFSESAFCKYVCPLGTFNFVYSTLSPLQITPRNLDTCRTCVGKECINGSYQEKPIILIDQIGTAETPTNSHTNGPTGVLGCGTLLFVPQIKSNFDCTLCLDCVRACPHENVALKLRTPGAELIDEQALPRRRDISFLLIILAFMGVLNAFGMVPPVYNLMQGIAHLLRLPELGWSNSTIEGILLLLLFAFGSLVLPVLLTIGAAYWSNQIGIRRLSLHEIVAIFAPSFIPLGLGIWTAHYAFHFLTGASTIIPVFQQFLAEHGFPVTPQWSLGEAVDTGFIGFVQMVALIAGFIFSSYLVQNVAAKYYHRRATFVMLPWMLILLTLLLVSVWIFSLPMEMRGTMTFS
jgi:ferredoxin